MVRRSVRQWQIFAIVALLVVCGAGYFTYHAFNGRLGLFARNELMVRLADLRREHAALVKDRELWAHRVELLSADKLDPDFLDENVRDQLNWAHPTDVVIVERSSGPVRSR